MSNEFHRIKGTDESLMVRLDTLKKRCHDVKKAHLVRKGEAAEEAVESLLAVLYQVSVEIVDLRRDVDYMKQQFHVFLKERGEK